MRSGSNVSSLGGNVVLMTLGLILIWAIHFRVDLILVKLFQLRINCEICVVRWMALSEMRGTRLLFLHDKVETFDFFFLHRLPTTPLNFLLRCFPSRSSVLWTNAIIGVLSKCHSGNYFGGWWGSVKPGMWYHACCFINKLFLQDFHRAGM